MSGSVYRILEARDEALSARVPSGPRQHKHRKIEAKRMKRQLSAAARMPNLGQCAGSERRQALIFRPTFSPVASSRMR